MAFLAFGASAAVASPIVGLFKSDDMDGGVFLTGRWTEGYVGGNPGGNGNGAHAASWDAGTSTLAGQWEIAGPTLVASGVQVYDYRTGGNGTVVTERPFNITGATATLKVAPWWTGSGDPDYTVALDYYSQSVVVLYHNNVPIFADSIESFHGTFNGFPGYELIGTAHGALVGEKNTSPPSGYPSYIPSGVPKGAYGDVGLVEIKITPEPASLALIGGGGLVTLARRRLFRIARDR